MGDDLRRTRLRSGLRVLRRGSLRSLGCVDEERLSTVRTDSAVFDPLHDAGAGVRGKRRKTRQGESEKSTKNHAVKCGSRMAIHARNITKPRQSAPGEWTQGDMVAEQSERTKEAIRMRMRVNRTRTMADNNVRTTKDRQMM